jgi:hypothetical protein
MISAIVCLIAIAPPATARDLLKEVRDHYRGLTTFSMLIEHHNSSGLFPGEYNQKLRWRKGSKFDLVVTKCNPAEKDSKAPNYFVNGKEVLSIKADGSKDITAVEMEPNHSPGWEVSGGPILSWLQDATLSKILTDPPKGLTLEWSFGPGAEWRKIKSRELLGKVTQNGQSHTIRLYVNEREKTLVGIEFDFGAQKGHAFYTNQAFNPKLPEDVGAWPKR